MNYLTKILLALTAVVLSNLLVSFNTWADEPFIGEIRQFPYNFCPRGWINTDGRLLSISSNTALFSILGTIYGGDGRTTLGIPNLNARVIKGDGRGPGLGDVRLGTMNGVDSFNYSGGVPAHTHSATTTSVMHATSEDGNISSPANALLADDVRDRVYSQDTPDVTLNAQSVSSVTTLADSPTPSSSSVNRRQPFIGMRFCIATTGVYPSRS